MLNNVVLIGRLTREPELRYLPGEKNKAPIYDGHKPEDIVRLLSLL